MANKPKSKAKESYFARYQTSGKQASNRKRKLLKLQKEQPNNKQIESALNDIHYRRGTPRTQVWSHQEIAVAKLFKKFVGKFDKGVFNTNPEIHAAAIRVRNNNIFDNYKGPKFNQNSMFSLRERAHSNNGMRVWI